MLTGGAGNGLREANAISQSTVSVLVSKKTDVHLLLLLLYPSWAVSSLG
jgi:hypothetical protein